MEHKLTPSKEQKSIIKLLGTVAFTRGLEFFVWYENINAIFLTNLIGLAIRF